MDLHTPRTGGPLMAVELKNNIIIHWRPHGVPLRFSKMLITNLHYISNDIDVIAGDSHAVVVFTFSAHRVFHPLTFYVHEVAKIRQSVVALLTRAPETTVIIKSGNTAGRKVHLDTSNPALFSNTFFILFSYATVYGKQENMVHLLCCLYIENSRNTVAQRCISE